MSTRLERLRERFASDPADRVTFEALEEHHFLQGEWSELVPIYERHLAATEARRTPAEAARLLYRLGHALDEAGLDPERAEACHRRALELDPGFPPALRRLRARCAAMGRWSEALALALREAEGVARPTERAALLAEVGEGALHAGEATLAVEAFEQALAADAGSRRAWLGIGEALEAAGRIEDAVERWEQALSFALRDGREQVIAWRRLGRLLGEALGDPARALAVYEAAHRAAPEEPEWLEAMAGALRALGRADALVALAERRLAAAPNARARAAVALDTGRTLLAHGGDPRAARAWLERAVDLCESGEAHLALAEAAGRAGDAAGRTWHLERAMELGAEIPSWSELGLGGEPPEAPSDASLDGLRRAVAERPDDPDALAALESALEAGPHELERVELLERLVALARDPIERVDHLLRLGALHESLDDGAAAASAYEMAFAIDPSRADVFAALERTLRKLERNDALAAACLRAADAAPPPRRAALLCTAGELALARGDAAAARASFAAALAADPACAAAHDGAARAAAAGGDDEAVLAAWIEEANRAELERLELIVPELARRLDALGRGEEALPALRRHAALSPNPRIPLERLARQLEELGDTDELSLVLERLDGLLDGPERGANQRRLAWLHAAEGRSDAAIDSWRAALRHDPSDTASLEALLEAYQEAGRIEDALVLLDELGTAAERLPRPVALRRARALERGGRHAEAARAWRALHEEDPHDAEPLAAWERCARAAGEPEPLAAALAARAAAAPDSAARAELELERARLLDDQLGRGEEARRILEGLDASALAAERREEAARRLESLLERAGDWAALCERLEARAERAPLREAWLLHTRIAELAETRLGDVGRARRHLEMAVAIAPEQPGPWRRLAALYDEDTQPGECLRAFEGELAALAHAGDDDALRARRLALHVQAARLAERPLGDAERAADHWRRALALAPDHAEAAERLLAHCEEQGRFAEAAALLRDRLDRVGVAAREQERAADLCGRLAELLARRLGRRDEAIAVLERAPSDGPGAEANAERLADLYAEANRHEALAALAEARAEAAREPRACARWRVRHAEALARAGELEAARAAYEAALAATPEDDTIRGALCALLRTQGAHEALATELERALPRAGARTVALVRELAGLYEGPLAAPARAFEHWAWLHRRDPSAEEPRERAIELALALGRLDDACALLEAAGADPRTGTGAARARCWARCAELLAGPLARPEDAVRAWRESLHLDPDQPALRRALRETLEARGRLGEALAELVAEWRAAPPDARAELAAHGADLAAVAAPARLEAWIARLTADVPDDPLVWEAIAALARRAGRLDTCERALGEAARLADGCGARAALHRARAALLAGPLAAPGRALAALEAAREADPFHPGVLADLDRAYAAADRPRERLEVLATRIALAHAPAVRAALARAAAPLATRLGESERAAELWSLALAGLPRAERLACLAPAADAMQAAGRTGAWCALAEEELESAGPAPERSLALRRALSRAWARTGRTDRALVHARAIVDGAPGAGDEDHRWLLGLLRAEGEACERARRLMVWAERAPDPAERRAAWAELAQLREERLGQPAEAAEAWRAVVRLAPDDAEGWRGLRRCAERCRDWPELARALEAEIERGLGPAAERWRRLGRLRWQTLGDAAGAEQAFRAARALEPDELTALRALQEIADATGAFERALALRQEEIALLGDADPRRRRSLWLAVAGLAGRQVPDPVLAARAYEEAEPLGSLEAEHLAGWAEALAASGERERWCAVAAAWCDHPDAHPAASDLLALAEALEERGRREEAEPRVAAALARDPNLAAGWRLQARLREARGDGAGAAEAWLRAGALASGLEAGDAFARAAALLAADAPDRALEALQAATSHAPDHAPAQARLAQLAEQEGRDELALAAATRLLALDAAAETLEEEQRRAALLAGTRAARRLERWPAAWQLAGEALALAPGHPDALAARGLAAFHLGATTECQRDLATRLAAPEPDPAPTQLLVTLARALESTGELPAALVRHEEALRRDPAHEQAHAGRLRVLERLGRRADAAVALADWAEHTAQPGRRAERFARAARLARLEGFDPSRVEAWLRAALAAEPAHATAWCELVTGLWDEGRHDDALAAASEGAERVASPNVRARLETVRGRALEARGDRDAALVAYRAAVAADRDAHEAALAAARLLRATGAWADAAEVLRRAAEGHGDVAGRAELWLELGRLLAGPLEDVPGALEAFDRAHALAPARLDVREARAALLAHLPERDDEALVELGAVLDAEPLRAEAIRRAVRVLRARGDEQGAARGLALLRALGALSPLEREPAPERIDLACAAALPELAADDADLCRCLAKLGPLADTGSAGGEPPSSEGATASGGDAAGAAPPTALAEAWTAAARELVGAPALLDLEPGRLREALAALLDDARAGRLGRAGSRAVRKLDPQLLARLDVAAWRTALRARAWARVVDAAGGDLDGVLATLAAGRGAPAEGPERTAHLAEIPEARELLRALERAWLAAARSAHDR